MNDTTSKLGPINLLNFFRVPNFDIYLNLNYLSFKKIQNIKIESKKYILETASKKDLIELFKLRSEIFRVETKSESIKNLDYDHLDFQCDHLVIRHRETGEICGTYRILIDRGNQFYSCSEFNLTSFLQLDGVKMEIGRACIALDHRNGHVIDLLWRGIAEYARLTNARYLFGCSTLFTTSTSVAAQVVGHLKAKEKLNEKLEIAPVKECLAINWQSLVNAPAKESASSSLIPPLLQSYLNAGAEVCGIPAYDYSWDCFDLFTVLDLTKVSANYKRRYFTPANEELNDVA
jgi:putative hemolysin